MASEQQKTTYSAAEVAVLEETILKLLDAWLRKRQRDQSR